MKEGRPYCGLDASNRDGIQRIKHETNILRKLEQISGVPKIIDEFSVWEHHYLVQTFHEGVTFGRWLALEYPFSKSTSAESIANYLNKLSRLVDNLIKIITSLHNLGLSHGDIQPHNIILEPDTYSTTLIDFETALWDGEPNKLSLGTPGYYDSIEDPLKVRDWIGLYRIVRGALLPISTIETLGSSKPTEFTTWVEKEFGEKGSKILSNIRNAALKEDTDPLLPQNTLIDSVPLTIDSITDLRNKLLESLIQQIDFSTLDLGKGDPLQFEGKSRKYCLAYGAAGIWKTLLDFHPDTEFIIDKLQTWLNSVENKLPEILEDNFSFGLFTGIAGWIELALRGHRISLAEKLVKLLYSYLESPDIEKSANISIESGMAGIALAGLYYYQFTGKELGLSLARRCLKICKNIFDSKEQLVSFDPDATLTGLLYGWSGAALAALYFYRVTDEIEYLNLADEFLIEDINKLEVRDNMLNLYTDDGRLVPYFSLGSAGVALVVKYRKGFPDGEKIDIDFDSLLGALSARPCAHAGLFKGEAGLLGSLLELESNSDEKLILDYCALYLVQKKSGEIYAPGDFAYRFSCDLATGLAGWLYAVHGKVTQIFPCLEKLS